MPKVVDHEARRDELSAIVAGLIASGGLEAATIREIARSSGYSKGVVEHYFENKEELISAALAWVNRGYEERLALAIRGRQGLAALRKMIEATLPLTPQVRDEWKIRLVFWSMAAIDPTLRKQQARRLDQAITQYEEYLRSAVSLGELEEIGDYTMAARHLLNITTGICTAALHQRQHYTRDVLMQEIDYVIERATTEI